MRRRGVGVGAVRGRAQVTKKYGDVGRGMQETQMAHVTETIDKFREALQEFAGKHREKIKADPEFRRQFHLMCTSIGVDPLASSKGFWSELLGVGDFYYELSVQVVQVCMHTRHTNGGMISLNELVGRLRASGIRSRRHVSSDDVRRAIAKLKVLGSGFRVRDIAGRPFVVSVPTELNSDHDAIISTAQNNGAFVTRSQLCTDQGWVSERADRVLHTLMDEGMVWVDNAATHTGISEGGERRFYFPSIFYDLAR